MKWLNIMYKCTTLLGLCPHSPAIYQKASFDQGDNAVKTEIVCEDCCMRPLGMAFLEILISENVHKKLEYSQRVANIAFGF